MQNLLLVSKAMANSRKEDADTLGDVQTKVAPRVASQRAE
jgi:hypothetical protein